MTQFPFLARQRDATSKVGRDAVTLSVLDTVVELLDGPVAALEKTIERVEQGGDPQQAIAIVARICAMTGFDIRHPAQAELHSKLETLGLLPLHPAVMNRTNSSGQPNLRLIK